MESHHRRALVVDDEPHIRYLTIRALGSVGFSCDAASHGDPALAMLHARSYDLLVTDLRIPCGNGQELATEVLSRSTRPYLAVVTAVAEPHVAAELLRRGVNDVIYKPVDCRSFARRMKEGVEAVWGLELCLGGMPICAHCSTGKLSRARLSKEARS